MLEWRAFNDQIAGAGTGPYATAWGVFEDTSGALRDSASGAVLPVTLSLTQSGAIGSSDMGEPDAGTPAAEMFAGQIHWGTAGEEAVELRGSATVTYEIRGLNPAKRYSFRGTAVRGREYPNRWTRVEIRGAEAWRDAHTAGVATTASVPALTPGQAAWNSGDNRRGDVVGWDDIDPGEDGIITLSTARHSGDYPALGSLPAGNTESPTAAAGAYAFQAIRLEQWDPSPPGPPVTAPDQASVHAGQKVRLRVLANDTGPITPSTLEITSLPDSGSVVVEPDGTILFAADAASTRFSYRVSGPGGDSKPAEVRITIADALRLAPEGLSVPATPPPTAWRVAPAFGDLRFSLPVAMATPPGDTRRLFVCEKTGTVRVIPDVTAQTPTSSVFLSLRELLASRGESVTTGGETGLLGITFHPDYANNRHFFVFYSVRTKDGLNYQRLSRFSANPDNPGLALPASEAVLIEQLDEATNHNGGDLHFGADGYLYVSLGDEGTQGDSLDNSQKITKDFFSGILRLDVDRRTGSLAPNPHPSVPLDNGVARYAVPRDNPWVHSSAGGSWNGVFNGDTLTPLSAVRTEFWAVGLRNPWRMAFDPPTGELWCGDVGGSLREEVNLITRGGNYGWAFREGAGNGPKSVRAPADFASLPPLHHYGHGAGSQEGNSITGGFVYRGTRFPALDGQYIFADYSSGNIWALRRAASGAPTVTRLAGEGGIVSFARDPSNGDVLLADIDNGLVRRLTASTPSGSFPQTLSATGLFADLRDLSPQPGLIPYQVNRAFWSDNALKRRWIAVPGTTETIGWARDGNWSFPAGTVWVKHFDIDMERGNPATRRRLETRLLVRTAGGAYGVSYRWNEAGTDAQLVPDEGVDFPLAITSGGQPAPQTWRIPSRAECLSCHSPQAGYALSSNTRQFNLDGAIHGFAGNQLDVLREAGYFGAAPGAPSTLPRYTRPAETGVSLEAQVRSWLAVNCSYCHQAGGTAPPGWDGRPELTLAETGLINGSAVNNGGDTRNRLIVPGNTARSIVLNRVAVTNGFTRMPAIGSNVTDPEGIALLTEWIREALPKREDFTSWRRRLFGSATSSEGQASADPDGDGHRNDAEFLAGTSPVDGSSLPGLEAEVTPEALTLRFDAPENRSWQVEYSPDLLRWLPWETPGNNGLPAAGGPVSISGPLAAPDAYHRVRFREN